MNPVWWVVGGLVVLGAVVNVAFYVKKNGVPGLPSAGGSGGGSSLDDAALKFATLLAKIKGDVVLSLAGRQALRAVMLFVKVCLDTLPDGTVKTKCEQGARDIDAAFFDPPTRPDDQPSASSRAHDDPISRSPGTASVHVG